MGKVIGIDLGNNKIIMSAFLDGEPIYITDPLNGSVENLLFNFNEEKELNNKEIPDKYSYLTVTDILNNIGTNKKFKLHEKKYTAEEILTRVLRKLCVEAETKLQDIVDLAVIPVPYNFNDKQKRVLKESAKKAGINGLRIINRVTAAGLAYSWKIEENKKLLICDLDSGTFSTAVIEAGDGVTEVLSINGEDNLGKGDFNRKVIDWLALDYRNSNDAELLLPKSIFNTITQDLALNMEEIINNIVQEAEIQFSEIDEIILSGSIDNIPDVRNMIIDITGNDPLKTFSPELCIATGDAIQAGILSAEIKDILDLDAASLDIYLKTPDNRFIKIIERNTLIPAKKSYILEIDNEYKKDAKILVLQGNNYNMEENEIIKSIELGHHYSTEIEVTIEINSDGIANILTKWVK